MPTHLGTITDAAAVGQIVGPSPALYVLDVSQTLGQVPVDVSAIRCDIAFGPARKFLRAPRGTAVLYMRSDLADRVVPLTPSFGTDFAEATGTFPLLPGLRRFNQFEYCVAGRLGLGEAVRYALEIGLDTIDAMVRERSRAVVDLLSSFGVDLPGGPHSRGIVSFIHSEVNARAVQQHLSAAGVNVWVSTPAGSPLDARGVERFPRCASRRTTSPTTRTSRVSTPPCAGSDLQLHPARAGPPGRAVADVLDDRLLQRRALRELVD